jgi:hypothetical protein
MGKLLRLSASWKLVYLTIFLKYEKAMKTGLKSFHGEQREVIKFAIILSLFLWLILVKAKEGRLDLMRTTCDTGKMRIK